MSCVTAIWYLEFDFNKVEYSTICVDRMCEQSSDRKISCVVGSAMERLKLDCFDRADIGAFACYLTPLTASPSLLIFKTLCNGPQLFYVRAVFSRVSRTIFIEIRSMIGNPAMESLDRRHIL